MHIVYTLNINVRRTMEQFMNKNGRYVIYHTKQKKKDATYIYYLLAWYYRINNKPYRKTLKNLGKLTHDQLSRYQTAVDFMNMKPNTQLYNLDEIEVINSQEYLPCAIGNFFWDFWQLSNIIDNTTIHKDVATADIAKILTIFRWFQTCSKSMTTQIYHDTCLPQLTGVAPSLYNSSRIYRELKNIEAQREALGQHIFKVAMQKGYTRGKVLFYDLSSGNISGLRCVMAKWGHCKDGFRTHVVLLLVITPEGYPVYWEILEGNTPDVTTIKPLIEKLEKAFGKIESVLCFDRGMVSDENLSLLQNRKEPIKFITALDGDQIHYFKEHINQKLIDDVKKLKVNEESALIKKEVISDGFHHVRDDLFYKELHLTDSQKKNIEESTDKLNTKNRRYFLAFNPVLAYLTHKHRKERVEEFRGWIDQYNKELGNALNNRQKSIIKKTIAEKKRKNRIADIDIEYDLIAYQVKNKNAKGVLRTSTTYKIDVKPITDSSYQKARQYDGLWMLVTNIKKDEDDSFFNSTKFSSYFDVYRLKNNIEESFKILSQFVGIEPFYVYKSEHIKAHFTICVLSYLLDITIINKIRNNKNLENISLERLFYTLKKCRRDWIKINKDCIITKITHPTKQQKEILDTLGCGNLISENYLSNMKITEVRMECA